MDKKAQMIALRDQGLKQKEIAERFGVSHQYVAKICGQQSPGHFIPVGDSCVYPNLRKWMNENKITRTELLRRMGLTIHEKNYTKLCLLMTGSSTPRKDYIDKLLKITGMTYEVMFWRAEDG